MMEKISGFVWSLTVTPKARLRDVLKQLARVHEKLPDDEPELRAAVESAFEIIDKAIE